MVELINQYNLIPIHKKGGKFNLNSIAPIRTFHLAEGPGGFIEAVANMRKCFTSVPPGLGYSASEDQYIGMTLEQDPTGNVHGWKKSEDFLKANPNVYLEHGITQTGDIMKIENFEYCCQKYRNSIDFITADGGFDFSSDFNKQELSVSNLLFSQIAFALCMQKKGGNFVLKIFDCFHKQTIDLLYLLSSFYREVYITKPMTSRIANSEKYVVCRNFIYDDATFYYPYLHNIFHKMTCSINDQLPGSFFVTQYLALPIPRFYLSKMEECVSVLGQQQLENIHYTITMIYKNIKPDKIEHIVKMNVSKCIQWCTLNNIFYNAYIPNVFIKK
jgi:23S rRNA U2552 (ribose-2'-O)-methylase RlmE/FtsJ